jgi:hypothetical protein
MNKFFTSSYFKTSMLFTNSSLRLASLLTKSLNCRREILDKVALVKHQVTERLSTEISRNLLHTITTRVSYNCDKYII